MPYGFAQLGQNMMQAQMMPRGWQSGRQQGGGYQQPQQPIDSRSENSDFYRKQSQQQSPYGNPQLQAAMRGGFADPNHPAVQQRMMGGYGGNPYQQQMGGYNPYQQQMQQRPPMYGGGGYGRNPYQQNPYQQQMMGGYGQGGFNPYQRQQMMGGYGQQQMPQQSPYQMQNQQRMMPQQGQPAGKQYSYLMR